MGQGQHSAWITERMPVCGAMNLIRNEEQPSVKWVKFLNLVPLLAIKRQLAGQVQYLTLLRFLPRIICGRDALACSTFSNYIGKLEDLGFKAGITFTLYMTLLFLLQKCKYFHLPSFFLMKRL